MKGDTYAHIGTSGWSYHHWKGTFYPVDLPEDHFLEYYLSQFNTVEINSSFYHLPMVKTLNHWRDSTPSDFIFSVKASRYLTHMKKLKDKEQGVKALFERIEVLGEKLGPILFQLPPHWHLNIDRLKSFLMALPKEYRYAFEFRDPSWFDPHVYNILAEHNAAFCIYDLNGIISPKEITAKNFIYLRLHGPNGPYQGQYTDDALAGWANDFAGWHRLRKSEIYCYFDNDQAGYAAQDALRLQRMVRTA